MEEFSWGIRIFSFKGWRRWKTSFIDGLFSPVQSVRFKLWIIGALFILVQAVRFILNGTKFCEDYCLFQDFVCRYFTNLDVFRSIVNILYTCVKFLDVIAMHISDKHVSDQVEKRNLYCKMLYTDSTDLIRDLCADF